jgi:hypothetical protein
MKSVRLALADVHNFTAMSKIPAGSELASVRRLRKYRGEVAGLDKQLAELKAEAESADPPATVAVCAPMPSPPPIPPSEPRVAPQFRAARSRH